MHQGKRSSLVPRLCNALYANSYQHLIGNEQETARNPQTDPSTNHTIESSSSNIDDKTMHEMYLWPFADAVHAGTASISKWYMFLYLSLNVLQWSNSTSLSVLVSASEQQLWVPKQQTLEWPSQDRARLPGICCD